LVVDLSFAFEAQTRISFVAVTRVSVITIVFGEIVQANSFTVQVQFVAVFVIDFCKR